MQTLIVALVVSAAALYLGARVWRALVAARRARAGAPGCGDGCGCTSTAGVRPQVVEPR